MITADQKNRIEALYRDRGTCLWNEPMAAHTSFHIGGPADVYLVPADDVQLAQTVRLLQELDVPVTLLGNGSNVLVADEGIPGAVLRLEDKPAKITFTEAADGTVLAEVSAGTSLSGFAREACDRGLADMEYATGIPGTVGGGIVMNAGAYGGEIKDSLREVRVLTKDGTIETIQAEELQLSYRYSRIPERGDIVLGAVFALQKGDREAIRAKVLELSARRREKQPLEFPSAGSTFKRPAGYFAGKLIEDAGLKGYTVGGAQVSVKHSGFVINRGNATCEDVKTLIRDVQRIVFDRFGVALEPEVRFLPNA